MRKNGRSGILNRTNAPKFGDDNPIPNANNTLNKRQNIRKGSPDNLLSVKKGLPNMKMDILRNSKMVFSSAENRMTNLFTCNSVGP